MNRSIRNYISLATLSVLLAAGGCDKGDTSSPETDPVEVGLFTKSSTGDADAASSYRLLVFKKEDGACIKNIPFVPGSSSVSLNAGSYSFAALSIPEGLDLPAAGTTAGLTASTLLAFAADATVQAFRLSPLTAVEVGTSSTAYTATLLPVTGVVSLRISGMPSGKKVTFALSNMYTSVALDGTGYSDKASYPLASAGETVCFPSDGNVLLSYQIDEENERTLAVGNPLKAGKRLSVELAWREDVSEPIIVSSDITNWTDVMGGDVEAN